MPGAVSEVYLFINWSSGKPISVARAVPQKKREEAIRHESRNS